MTSQLTGDHCTTTQFGQAIHTKPESIRRGLCVKGHFWGIKPVKLPSGRLLWPVPEINKILFYRR